MCKTISVLKLMNVILNILTPASSNLATEKVNVFSGVISYCAYHSLLIKFNYQCGHSVATVYSAERYV